MKEEPKYQKQHKVAQVYLKQFGYEKDGEWWLSVYKAGEKETENVKIKEFTAETNIFDLPFEAPEIKRHFENTSNIIENHYRTIISNLHNQKRLTSKDERFLNHIVANFLCRTSPFRTFIFDLLTYADTRDKFIKEMTMFTQNKEDVAALLDSFKIEFQLNPAIGILMDHLVFLFKKFRKVILKESSCIGWLTTDSPVYLNRQNKYEWIIPIESEIYMPLSKDFCLFMFHPDSDKYENRLRNLKINKVNEIDFNTFDNIINKIVLDYDKYLIMNTEIQPTDITKKL
ncbi:DUF4238 domain-containing protein [uncultured Sunxiuqinia sp.]|uniref:DUF4238 domain-containing protein n=1 Tax=uncultured Sunxiuqinia sp. TaxID=1573825 RepID=UPI002AA960A4|nr:DUF4238 domain-containing protein [uncultured Sunxiuqinia sp.]